MYCFIEGVMNFDFSEEQKLLRNEVAKFLIEQGEAGEKFGPKISEFKIESCWLNFALFVSQRWVINPSLLTFVIIPLDGLGVNCKSCKL